MFKVETKSFKEYLAEQNLLKETYDDEFEKVKKRIDSKKSSSDKPESDEPESDTDSDESKSDEPKSDKPESDESKSDANDINKLQPLEDDNLDKFSVTKEYTKNLSGNNATQFETIRQLYNQLKNTFEELRKGKYITSEIINGSNKQSTAQDAQNPEAQPQKDLTYSILPLDLTSGKSIYSIIKEFKQNWNKAIKSAKSVKNKIQNYSTLKNRFSSRKEKDAAYSEINKATAQTNEDILNDKNNILNEISIFRTPGEIASGIRNKFNTTNILNQAEKYKDKNGNKGSVYNVDDNMINGIRDKYKNEAFKIINKDIGYGLNYMKNAEKKINRYASVSRYLPKESNDKSYLSNIFQVLMQALSSAMSIGSNLRTLNTECSNSVNRLYNELLYQNQENTENLSSHDNKVALKRYEERKARQAEREEKRQAKKNEKDEEREIERAQQERDNAEIAAIRSKKELMSNITRDYVLSEIKKAHNRDEEYTLSDLKKKVLDDSEGNVKSLEKGDNKTYGTRVESLDKKRASAMASYILLNLIQKQPDLLNKIVFGSSPETELNTVFSEYFNDIYKVAEENSTSKLNAQILNKIEHPEEKKEKEVNPKYKKIGRLISGVGKGIKNAVSKTVDNIGKSSGTGTYGAKEFDNAAEAVPPASEDPTNGMNIVQYATYKAKKLNEK